MPNINATHDANLKSWIESANRDDCDFPIQNLPFGAFSSAASPSIRIGIAIGDQILDLSVIEGEGLLPTPAPVFDQPTLNAFMGLGSGKWSATRQELSDLLRQDNPALRDNADLRERALVPMNDAQMHLPIDIPGYTDFYSSRDHATNVGIMFRDPDNALMPNWLHIPIGYNGRASTVVVSGTEFHRPLGQIKLPGSDGPIFSPCRKLDIELEMGAIVGTPNPMGQPVSIEDADRMIFGYVLLNDWSARDIQVWEYQPLGPFQAKAFATTISPWVVTQEALEPFRVEGPPQSPEPLDYLHQASAYNFDIDLSVTMQPDGAVSGTVISRTNFKHMYWSSTQQLTHHAIGGCAMQTGDLLGSGTISGPEKDSFGSLLELTWNGQNPMQLKNGDERTFIEDGDSLTITGWCQGDGYRVGFGEAVGKILPAVSNLKPEN
jgi:fumarylacetoacetase